MSLDSLSDELILEIANQVSNYHGNRSLSSLVLCSHRMNQIASPILYSSFTQEWNKLAGLPNLLRLVLEKPHIGREIGVLCLIEMSDDHSEGRDELDMSGFSQVDFERCRSFIYKLEGLAIESATWMTALESGSWDAIVALLLFFTPSLEGIQIESAGLSPKVCFNQVIEYMSKQHHIENAKHSLKCLTYFSTTYWDTEMGMGINSILPICALPSITTVGASSIDEDDGASYAVSPVRYQVQDLSFSNSSIGGITMRDLLRCFTRLRKLSYEHAGAIVGSGDFLPHRIGEGLTHLHDSLEEIELSGMDVNEIWGDETAGPLGSLSAFKKLRRIQTEAQVLFGQDTTIPIQPELADILPASLEMLEISDCDFEIYEQLSRLIADKQQRFPVLKKVVINIPKMQAGGFNGINADGIHEGEALYKTSLECLLSHPERPRMAEEIAMTRNVLAQIEANRPSEEAWVEWRARRKREKGLVTEFGGVGVELYFDLGIQFY